MNIRKRYSSPLALALSFLGLCFAFMKLPWLALGAFLAIWFYATEVYEDPTETILVSEMIKEILRMLPLQAIAVVIVFAVSNLFYGTAIFNLLVGFMVVTWIIFSVLIPIIVTKNTRWYLDNHILVVIGYMLLCVASMVWIGPLSLRLIFGF